MKVVRPLEITSAKVTDTDLVNTYSDWSSGTTYSAGAKVVYNNYIYESLQSSNTNNIPSTATAWWVLDTASNKWAPFDSQVSTQASKSNNFYVELTPGDYFNSIALINMNATSVTVNVTAGAETLFDETYGLNDTTIADWYQYFFEPYDIRSELVVTNIPPATSAVATITFDNGSDTAAVGAIIIGTYAELGDSEYGASLGIIDYSIKETDDFGVTTFVERDYAKRLNASVFCVNGALRTITSILQSLRAVPTVWAWSEQDKFRPTIVYGFARDWNIDIAYTNHCLLSLEIEGLT